MSRHYVFGAGGIGLLIQYYLSKEIECTLIARQHTVDAFKNDKLYITGAIEEQVDVDCLTLDNLDRINAGDVVFVATKVNDTFDALKELNKKLENGAIVVLCQNGIGVYSRCNPQLEGKIILRLNCWMGVVREEFNKIRLAGTFKFDLSGSESDHLHIEPIKKSLSTSGVRVDCGNDIKLSEWQKALWNIAVNGICTIADSRNGEILEHEELKEIAKGLLLESQRIALLDGVKLQDNDLAQVFKSLETTKNNFNATLQDLRAGKLSEMDYLNGAVVKCARVHDQKAPINETIVNLVKYLEKTSARRKID